ncbi:MAG: ABC transporter permease subunit [Chlorobi bacterium]|nr:ABC transporter permease subunit [Chlorobiota bacterium]
MIRALKLEWLKIRNYRIFWILTGMYLLALLVITSGGTFFLQWLKSEGADFRGIDPTIIPINDFPDIWQNTTYLASYVIFLLAFIVIISVNNDLTYHTLRQNVIDGISKKEYLASKMLMIISMAVVSTLLIFFAGLVNGAIYSHVRGAEYIFDQMEFLAAFFYQIVIYCSLAFLLAMLIKKAGFVIVALFLYTIMFEPIVAAILINAPFFRDGIAPEIAQFFPIKAINNLISVPFGRYIFMEIQDYVSLKSVAIATGWFVVYLGLIYYILKKRDLK